MKDKLITYSESYEFIEYGLHRWKKIGIESDLEDGDDPIQCHITQVKKVEAMKATSIAELESMRGTHTVDIGQPQEQISPTETIIRDINSCNEVKVLETYRFIVKNTPELEQVYEEKLKELSK